MPRVGWLALFFVVATTWLLGGAFELGWLWVGGGGLTCIAVALAERFQAGSRLTLSPMIWPLLLWLLMICVSVLNPSHVESLGQGFPVDGNRAAMDRVFEPIAHVSWLPRTTHVERTLQYGVVWCGVVALGIALAITRWRRAEMRLFLVLVFVNVVVLSVVGTWFHFTDRGMIFGEVKMEGGVGFGSFHYKNYWVAYAVLALGCAVGLGHLLLSRTESLFRNDGVILMILLGCWIPVTFVLCESRAGVLMAAVFLVWLVIRVFRDFVSSSNDSGERAKGVIMSVIGAVILLGFGLFGWSEGREQVKEMWSESRQQMSGEKGSGRLVIMRDTVQMATAKPWLGWGLATFSQVYPLFESAELYIRRSSSDGRPEWHARYFEFAHCDWLQFWAETGVVGWVLLVATPLWWVVHCFRQGRRNAVSHWLHVGCCLLLLLACFEFPFGSEAVALLFTCCLVLGGKYALAEAKGRERRPV